MHAYSTTLRRLGVVSAVLAAGLFGTSACRPEAREDPAQEETSEPLYFEPIGTGQRASLADTTEAAFHDATAWAAYEDSLRPLAPFRAVDFDQAMVLLAALPQTTSGYGVEFVSVEQTDGAVVATYVVSRPGTDCLTASAANVPFAAVLVRRADDPVRFERQVEDYSCTGRRRF